MRDMNDIKNPKTFVSGRPKCYLSNRPLMATYNEENDSMENSVCLEATVLSNKQFIEMY
jgi:hypothetical protein